MPPKRFEGKFGIPPSHPVESLLTQALYRLPESVSLESIENLATDIASKVNVGRVRENYEPLSQREIQTLHLKLARHYEDNGESAKIDIPTLIDALLESPKYLQSDKGSIEKLFDIHEMKTLQRIAELRRKRAEMTGYEKNYSNPYESLFETESGEYYLARLLNMPHLEDESTYMNHCVGTSTSYVNKMKRGEVEILSFRDTKTHEPVATIEYDTHSRQLLQVKAKSDDIPNLSYAFAPELLEVLKRLPETISDNGEKRTIASNEITHLTRLLVLQDTIDAQRALTRDDLLFLYEVNEPIQGFDKAREPRIDELLETRDRKADIITMANCAPEHLTTSFTELSQNTEVFCEDTGSKLTLVDFREAKYQSKLPQLLELAQKLKETGSLAVPDLSFEGGIVPITYTHETIRDRDTAFNHFENADGHSPSYIWPEWRKNMDTWNLPQDGRLDIVVFSYNNDQNIRESSDRIVADVDSVGFRPLTLEEMTIAGIIEPKFTKTPDKYFVGLTSYSRGGRSYVPNLWQNGDERWLSRSWWGSAWNGNDRFLCVRK